MKFLKYIKIHMSYYSDLIILKNERFYLNLALSSIYIYTLRFLDFALVAWLLTNITKSSGSVGILIFVRLIPMVFSGIISGWLVDKFSRLYIIRAVIILSSLYFLLWAIYLSFFDPTPIMIFILTFLSGILLTIDISSRQSYLASLINKKSLNSGIALNIILLNCAWFIGPNIGMFLMDLLSLQNVYFLLVFINILNLLFIVKMPSLSIPIVEKNKYAGIGKGIDFALKNKVVLATLIIISIGNLTAFTFESMTPYFAKFIYNASPKEFSFMLSIQGLGALIGSIIFFPILIKLSRPGVTFAIATICLCIGSVSFTMTNTYLSGCINIALLGVATTFFMNMHSRIVLSQTPNPLRGRVQGLAQLGIGFFPIGSLLVGILGDNIGILNSMRIFSSIGIISTVVVLISFRELKNKIV